MFKIANDMPSLACPYYYCAKFMTRYVIVNLPKQVRARPIVCLHSKRRFKLGKKGPQTNRNSEQNRP